MRTRRRNNMLMITLICVTVLGLGIGFAAFASNLTIKSTAQVTPDSGDFKVIFSNKSDSIDTSDVIPTKTPTTITASNGEIDNTTDPTLTNLQANFTEPGQKVVYSLYAYNVGKYIAYLNSVTLKGNKSCTPGEGASIELTGKACEDIIVTVKVGNDSYTNTTTGITGKSIGIGDSTPVEITIEYLSNGSRVDGPFSVEFNDISLYYATVAEQDEEYTGESGMLYTGIIYRNSFENLNIDDNIKGYCLVIPGMYSSCTDEGLIFNTQTECKTMIEEEKVNAGDLSEEDQELLESMTCLPYISYETDLTNISQSYYLKHEVINNVVTASYACITYNENGVRKDVCLRGGDPSYYVSNQEILRGIESYFNTLDDTSSSTGKGYCNFNDLISYCNSVSLALRVESSGLVHVGDGSVYCGVTSDGYSTCD